MKAPRRLDADLLTKAETEALICACSNRAPTGIRNRAMIAVAWRSGLRIGEVLALRPKDVDLDSGTLIVQHGKGDKRRVVGIDAETAALVDRWFQVRKKRGINCRATVFCTLRAGQIESSYIRHLLPRLARKAQIENIVNAPVPGFPSDLLYGSQALFSALREVNRLPADETATQASTDRLLRRHPPVSDEEHAL